MLHTTLDCKVACCACGSCVRTVYVCRSPQHQDLQRLANQVLMGQSLGLTDLQRKMESQQATLAELLQMLKPASGSAMGGPTAEETSAMLATYAAQQPSLSLVKVKARSWLSLASRHGCVDTWTFAGRSAGRVMVSLAGEGGGGGKGRLYRESRGASKGPRGGIAIRAFR